MFLVIISLDLEIITHKSLFLCSSVKLFCKQSWPAQKNLCVIEEYFRKDTETSEDAAERASLCQPVYS